LIIIEGNPALGTNSSFSKTLPTAWEYLIVRYDWSEDILPVFNQLGALGWEKITTVFNPHKDEMTWERIRQNRAVFKRPL
jgi:hypothetical protein